MKKKLILFSLLVSLTAFPVARAAVLPKAKQAILKLDSSAVKPRNFNAAALERYKLEKEFMYDDVAVQQASWWDRFWATVWAIIKKIFGDAPQQETQHNSNTMRYFFMSVLLVAVVFVVMKFNGLDFKLFARRSKGVDVPYHEAAENIHELNFDDEIGKAIEHGNYRFAVRLLYLQTLKYLNDHELIHWQPEKTNEIYINEVEDLVKKAGFKQLTRQFEYVWYGDFYIDADRFKQISNSFKQFNAVK